MSTRLPVTPAPEPLEAYAQHFDPLFTKRNQRDAFRRYLEGLLLPAERNKTLTALANTEPVVGAQHRQAQSLQWFLSESTWDASDGQCPALGPAARAIRPVRPTTTACSIIDETGDRKDGHKTAHVGRQYLANLGKTDNGVVSVSSLWADERVYYPLEVEPYTPAHWFARGKADPAFRTKPQIALTLVERAVAAALALPRHRRRRVLWGKRRPFAPGSHRSRSAMSWRSSPHIAGGMSTRTLGSLAEVAEAASLGRDRSSQVRGSRSCGTFRDGHAEVWWALEVVAGPYGPDEAAARHRGHDRSGAVARRDDVVSGHQSARSRERARSDEHAGAGEPGGDRAAVWLADVGGAELQAGETCPGLGGVSSAE